MTTSTSAIREALATIAETHPDEAALVRRHLDDLIVHPAVLAERAIRSTEAVAGELTNLRARLDKMEGEITPVLQSQAALRASEAERVRQDVADRAAALQRSHESGEWIRTSMTAIGTWLAGRAESALVLALGAIALWFAAWLGVDIPLPKP